MRKPLFIITFLLFIYFSIRAMISCWVFTYTLFDNNILNWLVFLFIGTWLPGMMYIVFVPLINHLFKVHDQKDRHMYRSHLVLLSIAGIVNSIYVIWFTDTSMSGIENEIAFKIVASVAAICTFGAYVYD